MAHLFTICRELYISLHSLTIRRKKKFVRRFKKYNTSRATLLKYIRATYAYNIFRHRSDTRSLHLGILLFETPLRGKYYSIIYERKINACHYSKVQHPDRYKPDFYPRPFRPFESIYNNCRYSVGRRKISIYQLLHWPRAVQLIQYPPFITRENYHVPSKIKELCA